MTRTMRQYVVMYYSIEDHYEPTGWFRTTSADVAATAWRAGQYVTVTDATGATIEYVGEA